MKSANSCQNDAHNKPLAAFEIVAGLYCTRRWIHAVCIEEDPAGIVLVPGSVTRIAVPDDSETDLEAFLRTNAAVQTSLQAYRTEFLASRVGLCDFACPSAVSYPTLRVRECVRMLDDNTYRLVRQRTARGAALQHPGLSNAMGVNDSLAFGAALWVMENDGRMLIE